MRAITPGYICVLLVEAGFLVNFYEDGTPKENIAKAVEKIFRTQSGLALARTMFKLV